MRVTHHAPTDRQLIQRYGDGGFTVSGVRHHGPILVLPTATAHWQALSVANIDGVSLATTLRAANISLCLVGCGLRTEQLPHGLREVLRDAGVSVDTMETGAACRTYNMLVSEGRAVAAALIPR
jgi:uncharacterized protein